MYSNGTQQWDEWSVKLDTLAEYAPDLHGDLLRAYEAARDAAQGRAA